MAEQTAWMLAAASVGFLSAIFFAIGVLMSTPPTIVSLSSSFWDFSEPLARALAAQRAQFLVGALLLLAAFGLQVAAALASPTTLINLPQWLGIWPGLLAAVVLPTAAVAALIAWRLARSTHRQVLAQHLARLKAQP